MKVKDNTIQIMAHCLQTKMLMEVKLYCWLVGMPARANLKVFLWLVSSRYTQKAVGVIIV